MNLYIKSPKRAINKKLTQLMNPEVLLLLIAFCDRSIFNFFVLAVSRTPVIGFFGGAIRPIVYGSLFLLIIAKRKVTIGKQEIGIAFFLMMTFFITFIFYPENIPFIQERFPPIILKALLFFVLGLIVTINKDKMNLLGEVSCLALLVNILYLAYAMGTDSLKDDNMSIAYDVLPNVLFILNYAFNKKKLIPWLFAALSIFFSLSLGTRGPIVIICVFVISCLWRKSNLRTSRKIIMFIIFMIAISLFANSDLYISVLEWLASVFKNLGMTTRTIDKLLSNEMISYVSGRDVIFKTALQKIAERPFLGYGIYGDWVWNGWNVHNIYLELLVNYGVILGPVILIWCIFQIFKTYIKTRNSYAKDMIAVMVPFIFVRGIFGGEYLNYGLMFIIGFCIKEYRRSKYYKKEMYKNNS